MLDAIFEFAKSVGQVEPGEEEILSRLCEAAEAELTAKLKPGTTVEDCSGVFVIAAAWMALANFCICMQENGITAWSAGEVSVKRGMDAATQAAVYRGQAERLMAPYCVDDGFVFLGVKG